MSMDLATSGSIWDPRNSFAYRERLRTLAEIRERSYHLRPNARLFVNIPTTWIDQDKSGTYDPQRKSQVASPSPPPPKRRRSLDDGTLDEDYRHRPCRPRVNTWRLGRWTGESLVVTLVIRSDAGKELMRKLDFSRNSTPSPESVARPTWDEQWRLNGPFTSDYITVDEQFSLRPRLQPSASQATFGSYLPTPSLTSSEASLPTLGHAEARGCHGCLELGISCPLLEEDSTYPCEHCIAADHDCILIIPPARKRACESCRKARVRCSYREDGDHSLPCARCQLRGGPCVAGPDTKHDHSPTASTSTGTERPPRNYPFVPTPERPYLACTPCRRLKRWCSLAEKTRDPPCKRCRLGCSSCTFEPIERGPYTKRMVSASAVSPPAPTPTEAAPSRANDPDQAATLQITTSFAHPLHFSYTGPLPCHFCSSPLHIFGILGLGTRLTVSVLAPSSSEAGLTEVCGGHTAHGAAPTRMCLACTIDRLAIASCLRHEIMPISGLDAETFSFDAAFEELSRAMDGAEAGTDKGGQVTRWCSICPSPAFYRCVTYEEVDVEGVRIEQDDWERRGCGLVLCEACAVLVGGVHAGDLDAALRGAEAEEVEGEWPLGRRVDVELLKGDGELVRSVGGVGSEEEEGEMDGMRRG